LNARILLLIIVLAANVATALGVVYARHDSRNLSVKLGGLERVRDEAMAEWSRLKLEQAYLADAGMLESRARKELRMFAPEQIRMLLVSPSVTPAGTPP
jgi:cell division protein FtsL